MNTDKELLVPKEATRLEHAEYQLELAEKQSKHNVWPGDAIRSNEVLVWQAHVEIEKLRNIINELIKEKTNA